MAIECCHCITTRTVLTFVVLTCTHWLGFSVLFLRTDYSPSRTKPYLHIVFQAHVIYEPCCQQIVDLCSIMVMYIKHSCADPRLFLPSSCFTFKICTRASSIFIFALYIKVWYSILMLSRQCGERANRWEQLSKWVKKTRHFMDLLKYSCSPLGNLHQVHRRYSCNEWCSIFSPGNLHKNLPDACATLLWYGLFHCTKLWVILLWNFFETTAISTGTKSLKWQFTCILIYFADPPTNLPKADELDHVMSQCAEIYTGQEKALFF